MTSPLEWIAFAAIAAGAIGGALWAVLASRTFHAALGLGVTLVALAFLFISVGSPFLGVVQLIVYVGGILTLLVFAIMFVVGDEEEVAT